MLGLQLDTDPRWVKNAVEGNIPEILTDHAWCEQKAATTAISLMVKYPECTELVDIMADLAREEMAHFKAVHKIIQNRGFELGRERKDEYVGELMKFVRKGDGYEKALMDRLLFAAMIEARSCERFKVISDHLNDEEIAKFYYDLMASEARHYTTFLKLAKTYCNPEAVEKRWKEWLAYEGTVIAQFGNKEHIHG